ncbi:hypothetical protein L1P06_17660 (plasmid) [Edwardsiella piscicida]|uniref:hypothetical protein n=1 Tax=Edwardsiella TaxID=635 RepID=UPI001F1B6B70|nr:MULTISPECIES: hypothetical protein [Edwardsiella]UJT80810.1 hypothetical protein L1P06_17660 [Edwardsiella piscicida]WGE31115.1 hypothetical protein PHA77_19230 [Edwardsiella tarda]
MRDSKDNVKPCQMIIDNGSFFDISREPVCLRNAQSKIIYYNRSFVSAFCYKNEKYPTSLSINDIPIFSEEIKIFFSKLELECALLSSSVAQSRNVIIDGCVWQIRIEMLSKNNEVYFLWQFNKFYSIVNLINKNLDYISPEKHIDLRHFFTRLSDNEIMVLPFYLIGCSYVLISSRLGLSEDVVRKRIFTSMKKLEALCDIRDWRNVILTGGNLFYICSVIKTIIDDDVSFL